MLTSQLVDPPGRADPGSLSMNKILAMLNVVSWSGFWAFGYLALSADSHEQGQIVVAAILAALGFLTGVFAYMRLCGDRPMNYRRVEQG